VTLEAACASADQLTPREAELVALLMHGASSTKTLCRELGVKANTVHYYLAGVFAKLGCEDRVQVVSYAWRKGVVVGNRWVPR